MPVPTPTYLYRIIHKDNLSTILARNGLHAPNHTPNDGLPYKTIHNINVQAGRHNRAVGLAPGGTIHDYVPFYFGPLSVMMLNLKTGRVAGYTEGQAPLIYLVTTVQEVTAAGRPFVFSDGHGLANFTQWFNDLSQLDKVDWELVGQRYWSDRPDDNDRQRRKQAEFLVWKDLPLSHVKGIAVLNEATKGEVEHIIAAIGAAANWKVLVKRDWYYN